MNILIISIFVDCLNPKPFKSAAEVDYLSSFKINWQASFNNTNKWHDMNSTSNELYLTLKDGGSEAFETFETVLHIGCENASDYYGSKKGRCTNPYVAVKDGGGYDIHLGLTPSSIAKDINLEEADTSISYLSPEITKNSTNVGFFGHASWYSDEGEITAELDGEEVAKATVCAYKEKTLNVAMLVVHDTNWNSSMTEAQLNAIKGTIKNIYKQAIVNVNITVLSDAKTNFDLDGDSKIDVMSWMTDEMKKIRDNCDPGGYDKIIFAVSNPNDGSLGYMDFDQRYGFIHIADGKVTAHELGHGQDLRHTFELDSSKGYSLAPAKGVDQDNVMHPDDGYGSSKFRKNQWDNLN